MQSVCTHFFSFQTFEKFKGNNHSFNVPYLIASGQNGQQRTPIKLTRLQQRSRRIPTVMALNQNLKQSRFRIRNIDFQKIRTRTARDSITRSRLNATITRPRMYTRRHRIGHVDRFHARTNSYAGEERLSGVTFPH